MKNALGMLALAILLAGPASAAQEIQVMLEGRSLNPGDTYTIEASLEFKVIDPSRGADKAPRGKARKVDDSMVEAREKSSGTAAWHVVVPPDGRLAGRAFAFPFTGRIAPVANRLTIVSVDIQFTRSGIGPKGELISFTARQKFPVRVEKDNDEIKTICILFEGTPDAEVTLEVRRECSAPASDTAK